MLKIRNIIEIGIGSVFIIAAILKLFSIDEFEIYIFSYNILTFLATTFVSRIIIAGEFILGAFLILKIYYDFTKKTILSILVLFTFFLTYTVIFRNDDNCHCFGEFIELNPLESIVKNIVIIALLAATNMKGLHDKKKRNQRALSILIAACSLLAVFVVSPPDSIYKMIYSTDKEVSSIDLYESFDEVVKIDFNEDEIVFDSTSYFNLNEGEQLIAIVSSGCKYCKLGLKKLSLIMKKENVNIDNVNVFIWGSPEGIVNFRKETLTEDYSYWHIMPGKAIDVAYGRFPIFVWLEDKKIVNTGDFRDIDDKRF